MGAKRDDIPGYTVGKEFARTTQAIVYHGADSGTKQPVVLKLVSIDAGRHEVKMLQTIQDSNPGGPVHVAHLLGSCEDGPDLWMVLESFDETVDRIDPAAMVPLALMHIAVDTAKGLVEMHRAGIVDDDVKPYNMAFKTGSGRVAHIDLGYARRSGDIPIGSTVGWTAPEIKDHQPSETSPCYGWARSMEFLTKGKVGLGPDYRLDMFVPWVGSKFAELIAMCCEPDPDDRPSVPQLYEAVKRLVQAKTRCACSNAVRFHDGACPNCGRM